MGFKIVRNDIVKMHTEAIVNTANSRVAVGAGCDNAIYQAAGYDELINFRREKVGEVLEGEAFITPGFKLPSKYIIHAVSPVYIDGSEKEEGKLRSCYRKSLELAREYGIKSIAFPLIATGSFGYPREEGMRIAVDEIYDFLFDHEMDVYLVVFDSKSYALGEKIYPDLEEYIDQNYVDESLSVREEAARNVRFPFPQARMMSFIPRAREEMRFDSVSRVCKKDEPAKLCNADESVDLQDVGEPVELDDEYELIDLCNASEPVDLSDVENVELLEEKLNERVKHMSDTFSEYLLYLIESKGMTNVEVYKRAIVDKKTFSKIKNDKSYHPQKITALCLCVGAKLNLDEAKDLLARAGYALSPCDMTDIIFSFFIENEIYDMTELDIQLEEHGEPCIIQ